MTTTKLSQQIASFALAAIMTVGVMLSLNGMATSEWNSALEMAAAISAPRV